MSFRKLANGELCNQAVVDPMDNYPADIEMVPSGTKCGSNMVCYQQRCQHMKGLERVYGAEDCSDKCNNRGVCNHERQCHCDPGWAAPYWRDSAIAIAVSLAMVLILLSTIGGLLWYRKRRGPTKRPRHTSTGESNPAFQSGSVGGNPRLWPPQIGKPKFVESTASQVYKPATPQLGKISPSRGAPQPPMKMAAVPQPPAMQQPAARAALKPPTQRR
ncbi:hypothetical protein CRUP_004733 [Coryphaenoides rupestris]|nr:hypothetical protein CRUP_004733 [Coryphaenoides rupestris]